MSYLGLADETWVDLTVNLVPLGILVLVELLFFAYNPWGWDPVFVVLMHLLMVVPIASLALLTYVSGYYVQRDANAGE